MNYTHTVQGNSNASHDVKCKVVLTFDSFNPDDVYIFGYSLKAVNPDEQIFIDAYLKFVALCPAEKADLLERLTELEKEEAADLQLDQMLNQVDAA